MNISGSTLVLDTSLATLILNGDLWTRSKSMLVKFRSELKALIKQGHQLEELPLEDAELRRSLAAYKWMMEEVPKTS